MKDGLLTDAITGKLNDELENIATMLEGLPPDSQDWKARLKAHFDGIVAEAAQKCAVFSGLGLFGGKGAR